MKLISKTLITLLVSVSVNALELGNITIGGTGCFSASRLILIPGTENSYVAPLRLRVNKKSTSVIERKSCQIRIPVKLNPNEKLQVSDVSQYVRSLMNKGASVKSSLEISRVGVISTPLITQAAAVDKNDSVLTIAKKDGVVVESACGQDTIITGNLNAVVTGNGAAFVTTSSLNLKITAVACE